LILQLLV